MNIPIGYVDSWQITDAKDTHPSHRTAVIEVEDLLKCLEEELDKGNTEFNGRRAFSAGLFISELKKELEKGK